MASSAQFGRPRRRVGSTRRPSVGSAEPPQAWRAELGSRCGCSEPTGAAMTSERGHAQSEQRPEACAVERHIRRGSAGIPVLRRRHCPRRARAPCAPARGRRGSREVAATRNAHLRRSHGTLRTARGVYCVHHPGHFRSEEIRVRGTWSNGRLTLGLAGSGWEIKPQRFSRLDVAR